jgi:hypothetical protein
LTHEKRRVRRNNSGDLGLRGTVLCEEIPGLVRREPLVQKLKLLLIGSNRGKWDLVSMKRALNDFVSKFLRA